MAPSIHLRDLFNRARRKKSSHTSEPISPCRANEQDDSLLCRLPAELRQMIWEAYLGKHVVHITRSDYKLLAKECTQWDENGIMRGRHFGVCGPNASRCNHFPLLLTCKKIYFEFIHILYKKTCFDFTKGPRCLVHMVKQLPPYHVALISDVNLWREFYHPLNLKTEKLGREETLWVDVWEALAALKGLQRLKVELKLVQPHEADEWTKLEGALLEGVAKVTWPSHFELILPFPAAASTREETLPCTITRYRQPE